MHIDLYTTLDRSDRAVEVCLAYLRHLGIEWSPHPTQEEVRREYERTWALLGRREIEELIDLPLMSDPEAEATMEVLTKACAPATFTDTNLQSLVIWRMVNLSLEFGNTEASCSGLRARCLRLPDRTLATTRPAFGSAGSATTSSNGTGSSDSRRGPIMAYAVGVVSVDRAFASGQRFVPSRV